MDAPIPEKSRKKLQDLFVDDSLRLNNNQWVMIVPKCKEAGECTHSNSSQYFVKQPGCQNEVKKILGDAFDKVFTETGHVMTFWDDFAMNIIHKLGLTYRELANGKMEKYSEAQLQQMVLNPLMRELSKAACIIPNISNEAIKTDFLVQDEVEIVPDQPGQKPAVDALIQISKADGKVIACVPIEKKVDINIKHYSQIACYINKLSTVKELTKSAMIGVIIDKKLFRLAFSVYRKGEVPLPIVYIPPPIEWKSESYCTVDQSALLILACTFLNGQLKRYNTWRKSVVKYPQMTYKSGGNSYKESHTSWVNQQNKRIYCHYKKSKKILKKRWQNKKKRSKNFSKFWVIRNVNDPKQTTNKTV